MDKDNDSRIDVVIGAAVEGLATGVVKADLCALIQQHMLVVVNNADDIIGAPEHATDVFTGMTVF